jgi:hypothetical protein
MQPREGLGGRSFGRREQAIQQVRPLNGERFDEDGRIVPKDVVARAYPDLLPLLKDALRCLRCHARQPGRHQFDAGQVTEDQSLDP